MKIGIFGGAFNPVHNGHIKLAENYFNELELDKLIFIPTAVPPHKASANLASAQMRFDMLKLAIHGNKDFDISLIEFERDGKSYTYDTLKQLEKMYPCSEFYLIIGADQFLSFHLWYKWQDILKMVTLCTAARESEAEKQKIKEYALKLEGMDDGKFYLLKAPVIRVSSSEVRNKLSKGMDISNLVDEKVYNYIIEKGIYGV